MPSSDPAATSAAANCSPHADRRPKNNPGTPLRPSKAIAKRIGDAVMKILPTNAAKPTQSPGLPESRDKEDIWGACLVAASAGGQNDPPTCGRTADKPCHSWDRDSSSQSCR